MKYFILLLFCFVFNNSGRRCIQLPIKNGIILPDKPGVHKFNKAILIAPTDNFDVKTCLKGRVAGIIKDDWGYSLAIKTDSIGMIYSGVDSITVKMNDIVKRGEIIGVKSKSAEYNYIIFSVHVGKNEVNPIDCVVKADCSN